MLSAAAISSCLEPSKEADFVRVCRHQWLSPEIRDSRAQRGKPDGPSTSRTCATHAARRRREAGPDRAVGGLRPRLWEAVEAAAQDSATGARAARPSEA